MELSVVLPTHNERNNVLLLIYCLDQVLTGRECEIIVVDDGSTDGTEAACQQLRPRLRCPLTVLVRPEKLGLGSAYKRGVQQAAGKYIVLMDADLSHDPRDIPRLLEQIVATNANVVIGSRYRPHGGVDHWPLFRRTTSRGANLLARWFTGRSNTDLTNSFRIYKTDVIKAGINQVRSTGFSYQMEILYHCPGKIEEIPVKFHQRVHGCSKLGPLEYFQFLKWGSYLWLHRLSEQMKATIYERAEIF